VIVISGTAGSRVRSILSEIAWCALRIRDSCGTRGCPSLQLRHLSDFSLVADWTDFYHHLTHRRPLANDYSERRPASPSALLLNYQIGQHSFVFGVNLRRGGSPNAQVHKVCPAPSADHASDRQRARAGRSLSNDYT